MRHRQHLAGRLSEVGFFFFFRDVNIGGCARAQVRHVNGPRVACAAAEVHGGVVNGKTTEARGVAPKG